jgi:hypothetical protein
MSYTNLSVNNNITYITGCLVHLFEKENATLFKPIYLVYPDYPNYMSLTRMSTSRRKTKEDQPRQGRKSINSSLQGSSGITRWDKSHNLGWSLFLSYSFLPKPINALKISFILHNKITMPTYTHDFLITHYWKKWVSGFLNQL